MKRIYFLAPDVSHASQLVEFFRDQGINDEQLHLVADESVELGDLPEADALENSDIYPAIKRGTAAGGSAGLLAGIAAVTTGGLALGGAAVLGLTAAGAGFGAWVSGMIGAGLSDQEARDNEQAIRQGSVLMMVDLPSEKVDLAREKVRTVCPEAEVREAEVSVP